MLAKTVYLSLGSNMGEREDRLRQAIEILEREGIAVTKQSSIYETAPQDVADQPWFLNMAIECRTTLLPLQLMNLLLGVEREIGRVRQAGVRRGPRPIDLDLLLFSDAVIQLPQLTVPHPRMLQRRFVLEPLLEIAPDLKFPVDGKPLRGYLAATMNQPVRVTRRRLESRLAAKNGRPTEL
jgi:2-amino-4-hydroxy-6-hydroxymethyldihydropteridine diphosphokinase